MPGPRDADASKNWSILLVQTLYHITSCLQSQNSKDNKSKIELDPSETLLVNNRLDIYLRGTQAMEFSVSPHFPLQR